MDIPSEAHGLGTNYYTYFVTNSPGLPWTRLPDVKPSMIIHARKIRSFFTGCLSSTVAGYPIEIGREKEYLRAQIARITATTHISPAGYYILSDTNDDIDNEQSTNEIRTGKLCSN
jgi:radial spoke head protein 4/6